MKASLLYRIAAGLLVLFAIGHTIGFRQVDPTWKADSVVGSMRTTRFDVQGFSRSYWDFFTGFGLFVTVFLLFAAILAWQLGGLTKDQSMLLSVVSWAFVVCFAGITVLSWNYFFVIPAVFSGLITLCLLLAAWLAGRS